MKLRFSVIGLTHNHVYSLTNLLLGAGAELSQVYTEDAAAMAQYQTAFPQAQRAQNVESILEDESIQLIIGLPLPDERAALGIRVMQHGKDYLADKPGFTTLEQLEAVRSAQQQYGQKFIVYFSERLANPATVKAGELVESGAIGRVIQVIGMGPHLLNPASRPQEFFKRSYSGGILNDLACHQIDQFLYFTGSDSAEVVTSQVGNFHHPEYPELEDFGDIVLRSDRATGYARVDWFTPGGLGVWGDVRLFLLGTEGYIEVRKIVDLKGRPGGNHLFLVNQAGQQYIDCNDVPMPFGEQVVKDVLQRTETAMTQKHSFLVSELSLKAQMNAVRVTG